ncbi:MAG: hypothetical protein ACSHXB_15960 [Sulfitobacter sp.]
MNIKNTFLIAGASALGLMAGSAWADQVILDDLIVDGSICVGQDCVNGESFGFDTIRLKENNLRIKAQDTSNSASFPSRDWQLTFNDSSNGGMNKFSIDDIDGGRTPFTIEAGAPSNSLYVDDGGRIGSGTAQPVVDLHVVSGNTPTLRLQQDGSSGFGAQTWDMAGNETNFFIRDASNGSTLPFRIEPGAPSNVVYLEDTGDVGLGTTNPADQLHVMGGSILVENAGPGGVTLIDSSDPGPDFRIQHTAGTARLSFVGTGGPELEVFQNGSIGLRSNCISMNSGASSFACTFSAGGGVSCLGAGTVCP